MNETRAGDKVVVHYTGRLEDGTVFDSTEGRAPIDFTAGSDEVILGISRAVIGMAPGQSKTVTIAPEEGFGDHNPDFVQKVDRDKVPTNVSVGSPLQAENSEGTENITVWVTKVDEQTVTLDANHPLSGRNLIFDIELLSNGS